MGVPSGILTAEGLTTVALVLLGFGFPGETSGLAVSCAASEAEDWVEMEGLAEVGCRVSELCDCCTSCAATRLQLNKCTAVKGSSENASVAEVKRFILCKGLPVGLELTTGWVQGECRQERFGKQKCVAVAPRISSIVVSWN